MELIYPSYYKDFACIAGDCPDSCCHEWEVQVDTASAAWYRAMEGALGDALREALYDEEGETYLRNVGDRCPMWREDGLCRIQAELGEQALCDVCRDFPRLKQDYGDFVELGLSGGADASEKRLKLLKKLNLPEHLIANAMLQALNLLYSLEELTKLVEAL